MGLLIALAVAVIAIAIFDLVVISFGVDSRDTIHDDHGNQLTPRWL